MKPAILSLAVAFLLTVPVVAGCAGEEAEAGEAAYPPVGYTPPGEASAAERPAPPSLRPSEPQSAPQGDPRQPAAQGAWQWAPPADDTPGGDPGGDPGTDESEPPGVDGANYADTDPSALTDFRSTLDPYGTWADDPSYGTVWVPSESVVGSDFTPYVSGGHWAYDSDYTWVSDYDWGWAPFHYGRWVYASGPGWEWVPGREYAGAWVSWRYGVDDWAYVGWAPLAPTWCWRGGAAVGIGFVPRAPYAFVGTGELFAPRIGPRVVAGAQVGVIASHTRPYVPASSPGAAVGGRVAARPSVGGPSPASLRIAPDAVARSAGNDRGLTQARAFSRPTTAVALGARAPEGVAARSAPGAFSRSGAPVSTYRPQALAASSHFGGRRLGGGFAGSAAASGPMRSYPSYGGGARPYFGPSSPSPSFRSPSAPVQSYSGPSAGRSFSGGTFRSAPSVSGFHGGGSSGSFQGGGAGSSFHGGGGGSHGSGGGGRSGGHR
jgi:hypothetical protein